MISTPQPGHTRMTTVPVAGAADDTEPSLDVTFTPVSGGHLVTQQGIPINPGGSWSTRVVVTSGTYNVTACYPNSTICGENDGVIVP
jgi:hypothetical protein